MPPPPAPGLEPYAHLVGANDGWAMWWGPTSCEDPGGEKDHGQIPWPFDPEAVAAAADMVAAGFTIAD